MKQFLSLFFLFSISSASFSAIWNGQITQLKQPDGSKVDLRLFGDSYYYIRAEGLDGYTLIRDPKTKWICYAQLADDQSRLIPTSLIYKGLKNDSITWRKNLEMPLHLDVSPESKSRMIEANKKRLGEEPDSEKGAGHQEHIAGTAIHPVSGNIKALCIVIDFSDEPGVVPIGEFQDFCNKLDYTGFGNNGSLRKYYLDISGGILDYENVVFGYYRAPQTFAAYDAMPYATGAQKILNLALNWIKNQGFDFSTLSLNPDNSIMAINMMYTGEPPTWAEGMWHHAGSFSGFAANGVHSGRYNCSPANSPLGLGVVAHENGHMIGKWPDTYKYNSNTGPDGIGSFDLMCSYGNPLNPPPPNPLFRANAGWGKVKDITNFNGLVTDTSEDGVVYKYSNPLDTNEFFLLESRQKAGRSLSIPGDGLAIWHLDRNGDNQTTHHEVYLVHANNSITSHGSACFRAGFKPEYSGNTTPKSLWYNGDPSGLRVWNIGPRGAVMTYKLGAGQPGAFFHLSYEGVSNDDNANGFPEAGESIHLNINTQNLGQLSSGPARVACTVLTGGNFVTVSNDTLALGTIGVNQSLPSAFQLTILPNAPLGTEISFRFTVFDSLSSIYLVRKIVVGNQIIMSSDSVNSCGSIFMDEGGLENYNDNTDFIKTIFPSTPEGKVKVNFVEFDVEPGTDCETDYMEVYDGPNTSGAYLGTYCGIVIPPAMTSTDPTGALTFYFHSDGSTNKKGWRAMVTCATTVEIADQKVNSEVEIYPNPAWQSVNIRLQNGESGLVTLMDLQGREILSKSFDAKNSMVLPLGNYSEGLYLLKLKTTKGLFVEKLEVRH